MKRIFAGQLLVAGDDGRCKLSPGFIRVDGETIAEVVLGAVPSACDAGSLSTVICPGFVDAHLHLPQFDIIGGHGLPLLTWLSELTFPAERRWADNDFAISMIHRVLKQCISNGTTSLFAYASVHHSPAISALEIATQMGMSGAIGQVLMDREAPDDLCRDRNQLIDETSALLDRFPSHAPMSAAVTPRFAITCTNELLTDAGALAKSRNAYVQTHLSETIAECERVCHLFDGQSYVDVYRATGILTDRSIMGHGIYLDRHDREILSHHGAILAHCPTANSFLRSGSMRLNDTVNDRARVVLGSDIGAGYERSMVRVGRAMIETASAIGEWFPTAANAWHQITAGNADRLGLTSRGRLVAGNVADLVFFEPDRPLDNSSVDPLSAMLFAWDDRWIKQVYLSGRRAY